MTPHTHRTRREVPGPGQESVWDYPRPPRLERTGKHLAVVLAGRTIAESDRAWRVLETSHPPVYFFPREDVETEHLRPVEGASSFCEWKGRARYFDVVVDDRRARRAAFSYPSPHGSFTPIADHVAFYAGPMDACLVDGEPARPQAGGFYAGWITKDLAGPFKGEPGTLGW